jgi:Lysophospholipase L1 and related esterases
MSDIAFGGSYNFLVSGDSISRGIVYDEAKGKYSVSDKGYVSLVQAKLKGVVSNVARFGNTIVRGAGKLGREIEMGRPDVVLIEYGGNDCDFAWDEVAAQPESAHEPQTGLGLFEETLARTVSALKDEGIVPVLMTLPPLNADSYLKWVSHQDSAAEGRILKWLGSATKIYWWQERYSSAIRTIAERTGTRCIDVRGAFLQSPDVMSLICRDGIHPNEAGQALIAKTILDYVSSGFPWLLAEELVPVA